METKTNLGLSNNESADLLKKAMLYDVNQRHIELPPEANAFANSERTDLAIVQFSEIILSKLDPKSKLYDYLANNSSFNVKHHPIIAKALRNINLSTQKILH